jgi:hypothetical protein
MTDLLRGCFRAVPSETGDLRLDVYSDQEKRIQSGMVVHTYNPSYLEGRGRRIAV